MNTATLFSSATDEWTTPIDFYVTLSREFYFMLDVAARYDNHLCDMYLGPDHEKEIHRDGLVSDWASILGDKRGEWACFMNPPYSRGLQGKFIAKAADERRKGVLTVALLPARTDTKAFHTHIYDASRWQPRPGIEIRLLPGRLKFGGAMNSAPFPSMIVVFRP